MGKKKSFVMLRTRTQGYELGVNTAKSPDQAKQDGLRTMLPAGMAGGTAQQKEHNRTDRHRVGQAIIFRDFIHI